MNVSRGFRHAAGLIGALLLAPCVAQAQSTSMYADDEHPSMLAMTGDLLIARPVGLVTTVGGAALFVLTLPFSAAGGNVEEAGEVLVVGPARTTFVRCLGCRTPGHHHKSDNSE
jgi:hypothetical protein